MWNSMRIMIGMRILIGMRESEAPVSPVPKMKASGRTAGAGAAGMPQINAELFTLTYGAVVRQLVTDFEDVEEVNKQLDKMGYNIGVRLVDEFLAKSNTKRCSDFKETAQVIGQVGFKMFLGVTAAVTNWTADGTECSLVLTDNPLVDFVELPEACAGLSYCNALCGVLRGALEQVNMRVECYVVKDQLRGADGTELRLKLLELQPEAYPFKDDD